MSLGSLLGGVTGNTGFLGTALGVGGMLGGAYLGYKGQQDTNEAQMSIAREQMDFQERMSSTAYQRATGDMMAAGLNPMLAYQQGGASSPAGSMPTIGNKMAAAVSSAYGVADVVNKMAQTENIQTDTAQKGASTKNIEADLKRIEHEATAAGWLPKRKQFEMEASSYEVKRLEAYLKANYPGIEKQVAEARLLNLEIPHMINQAFAEESSWKRYVSPFLDDAGKIGSSAAGFARAARPGAVTNIYRGGSGLKIPHGMER